MTERSLHLFIAIEKSSLSLIVDLPGYTYWKNTPNKVGIYLSTTIIGCVRHHNI